MAAEERRHEGAEVVGGWRAWSRRRGKERGTQVCGRKLEYCRYERERVLRAASIRGAKNAEDDIVSSDSEFQAG